MLKGLTGENKHSSSAMEEVKLACIAAGLTQRKAHTRDYDMHFGKRNCLNVKYNTQDEVQSSILQKPQLPREGCEIHEAFRLSTLH